MVNDPTHTGEVVMSASSAGLEYWLQAESGLQQLEFPPSMDPPATGTASPPTSIQITR